jgi:mannose-6-phosphate isomerase-like protein (cupin superfamily)
MSSLTPIRRVVTGKDAQGRSKVQWDGHAPNTHEASLGSGRGHTDIWVWHETPLPINGANDDGNLPYLFSGPKGGGHFRVVQARALSAGYERAKDPEVIAPHPPKPRVPGQGLWDRGGNSLYESAMHKTQTLDYGIVIHNGRDLVLDDCQLPMKVGDIVVQVGAWHQWRFPDGARMAFDMIWADFGPGDKGLAVGNDKPLPAPKLPAGVKGARRIVTIDKREGEGVLVGDTAAPDIRLDPARPGYAAHRLWVASDYPPKMVYETLHLPHTIEPPKNGSVCRVIDYPPDATWKGKVGEAEVKSFFRAMGSPGASTWSASAPHPYMQKTHTVDFVCILEGEITLVLDTEEVNLKQGEIAVLRGANHAWSNRSSKPARISVCAHDGKE